MYNYRVPTRQGKQGNSFEFVPYRKTDNFINLENTEETLRILFQENGSSKL